MVTKSPTNKLLNTFSQIFSKSGARDDDTSSPGSSQSDTLSPEALAKRLKHKRREDSVRATELGQLRHIIRDGRAADYTVTPTPQPMPSRPRDSTAGALERTSIRDKIDGAEAHLNQWWGTGSAPLAPTATPPRSKPQTPNDDDLELDFTGLLALSPEAQDSGATPFETLPFEAAPWQSPASALGPMDQCLRDAALHYAQGEWDAAGKLLADMLGDPSTAGDAAEDLVFALFDVYRCSGQQARFDALALDYAERFGRSPGEWYSLADSVTDHDAQSQTVAALDAQRARQTFWRCPPVLDEAALADCLAHDPVNSQVVSINWLPLQRISDSVVPAFSQQLTAWSASPVELQWVGLETLLIAVRIGGLGVAPSARAPWWMLQLDLFCMAQQPLAFEELAMEYCIALEVSPPSWRTVACKMVQADEVPLTVDFVATLPWSPPDADANSAYATYALGGNITGKKAPALRALDTASRPVRQLAVSCARLGRIDLEAGLELRDWLQECRARDCEILFTQLPKLVLVYFQTLGLQELASLSAGSH